MRQQSIWSASTLILPIAVVIGYALVTGIGLLWPDKPMVSIVASIIVSIGLWLTIAMWFKGRTGWWRVFCIPLTAVVFVFPMVGAASLGTDLALEREGEHVTGRVADIDVEQTNRRTGSEAFRTTYTFVSEDDGRELGTVDYRGDKDAYDLELGDSVDLLVDPSGELPVKLAERVDSGDDIVMLVIGGVLFAFVWLVGLVWPAVRRVVG